MWAALTGINIHPEWYEGLSFDSSFEDFQESFYRAGDKNCTRPCKTRVQLPPRRPWETPSLFCFTLARQGTEMDIVRAALSETAGIFECEEYAVLSNQEVDIGQGVVSRAIDLVDGGLSKDGTSANSQTFMNVWEAILQDGRYDSHDFTVKVDPDTVMLPSRLRTALAGFVGSNIYVPNCDLSDQFPGSTDYPMMYGALEVLSKDAVKSYSKGAEDCKGQFPWNEWGEDLYLGHCLQLNGVEQRTNLGLVADKSCKDQPEGCLIAEHAAFHYFKSVDGWLECLHQARR
jgi:hypothetical protein